MAWAVPLEQLVARPKGPQPMGPQPMANEYNMIRQILEVKLATETNGLWCISSLMNGNLGCQVNWRAICRVFMKIGQQKLTLSRLILLWTVC